MALAADSHDTKLSGLNTTGENKSRQTADNFQLFILLQIEKLQSPAKCNETESLAIPSRLTAGEYLNFSLCYSSQMLLSV